MWFGAHNRGYSVANGDPYATRGPQAGDVWINGGAGTDGSGSQASPWNVLTVARVQSLTAGQALWVQGTVQWPDMPNGTAQSGTPTNRIMCKVWPGQSGTFNFPAVRPVVTVNGNQPSSAAGSGGGYYWDWVGLNITSVDAGLWLGDWTGGRTNASHFWRFIDCIGVRSGSTYTDNQGVISAPEAIGIQVIRGSYTSPSGEANNQSGIWMDWVNNSQLIGVLFSQGANPLYFKHTDQSGNTGIVVKNCIILNGGRAFTCPSNFVQFINCGIQSCTVNPSDEGGNTVNPGNNWTVNHCTFVNSDYSLDPSGTEINGNNTLTNCAWVGTSRFMDNPFNKQGGVNMNNLSDYSACDGSGNVHYVRNSTSRTLAQQQVAFPGQEVHGVAGSIVLVGGTSPGSTASNWAMSSGVGRGAGNDGNDCGVNYLNLLTTN